MAQLRQFFISLTMLSLALFAVSAHAHATLKSSVPAGASVGPAPQHIVLEFSHPVRLTSLVLTTSAGVVNIAPLPNTTSSRVEVPAPKLSAGDYDLAWRSIGPDGHIMSGHFGFTVQAAVQR